MANILTFTNFFILILIILICLIIYYYFITPLLSASSSPPPTGPLVELPPAVDASLTDWKPTIITEGGELELAPQKPVEVEDLSKAVTATYRIRIRTYPIYGGGSNGYLNGLTLMVYGRDGALENSSMIGEHQSSDINTPTNPGLGMDGQGDVNVAKFDLNYLFLDSPSEIVFQVKGPNIRHMTGLEVIPGDDMRFYMIQVENRNTMKHLRYDVEIQRDAYHVEHWLGGWNIRDGQNLRLPEGSVTQSSEIFSYDTFGQEGDDIDVRN